MTILSVDASTQTAGAALVTDQYIIAETNINAREMNASAPSHSETLLPAIEHLFTATGLSLDDVDVIACVSGPGSFTGLRIGAATAMGLAKGAGKGIVPVPTLDALAYNVVNGVSGAETPGFCGVSAERFLPQAKRPVGGCILAIPVMDARRGQVYAAVYQNRERVSDYLAEDIRDVLPLIPPSAQPSALPRSRVIFLGDGADAYRSIILESLPHAEFAPPHMSRSRAASAAVCALDMTRNGFRPVNDFELLYVRKPQAVRDRERKGLHV